jgi:beta-glucosidase
VATSAYQVEGAVDEGGRGPSIWDTFAHTPGAIAGGDTGDVASDQYHRFAEDVAVMADLGIGAYRFSVAWTRIQPEGRGPANPRGLDHYRAVVAALNERGIVPIVTLFHWDLPQALQDEGGWTNRSTAERFVEYAQIVRGALAGEVGLWITLNEPWVAAWLGYGEGVHAPGIRDVASALAATHHQLLAHGLAVQALAGDADVGIALNLEPHRPATADARDAGAARLAGIHMNEQFLGPLFGAGYPGELVEHYRDVSDYAFVRDGDLRTIAAPLGFLGVNYYRPQFVTADPAGPGIHGSVPGALDAWSVVPPGMPVTAMDWPIDPSGLGEVLGWVAERYGPARIIVTENGAAFDDRPSPDGAIEDGDRIRYLSTHLDALADAIGAGAPVEGYVVWSLLDNFEWAQGYAKRFGIVAVDPATLARTPKASARWYAGTIARAAATRSARVDRSPQQGME